MPIEQTLMVNRLPENCLPTTCLIMAAGKSSRMLNSELAQWKMNLPLDPDFPEKTMLDFALENAMAACDKVILVCGFQAEQLQQKYAASPLQIITNRHFEKGMASSIACGLQAVSTDHCFISHGDMPFLTPSIYQSIWRFHQQHSSAEVVFPYHGETVGHPVLIARQVFPSIQQLVSHAGGPCEKIRPALLQHHHQKCLLDAPQITLDIDTPKALHQARAWYQDHKNNQ